MNKLIARKVFMWVIESHLNRWYKWGGDDPAAFDCSGLVIEGLQAVGMFPTHADATSDGLWHRFKSNEVRKPTEGCLLFWFNKESRAYHIAVAIGPEHCLSADGGGSTVKTIKDAMEQNAYIKVRRIDHRKTYPRIVDIFEED